MTSLEIVQDTVSIYLKRFLGKEGGYKTAQCEKNSTNLSVLNRTRFLKSGKKFAGVRNFLEKSAL